MHELYELKELLCKELEEIGGKGELTGGNLGTVDTLAHALKNVNKIIEDKEDEGYSGRYMDGYGGHVYARGRTNAARDSRGRYSGNYSREYSRAAGDMAERMRELANDAPDEDTRREIERMASKMDKL